MSGFINNSGMYNNNQRYLPQQTIDVEYEVLDNTPWYKRINMPNVLLPRVTRGGAIGGITGAIAGGAIGGYFANQGNGDISTTALVGAGTGLVGGVIGSATGYGLERLGSNIANRISNNQATKTATKATGNALGTVAKIAIPLTVLGGIGYGGYHVGTADDRARAKLEQEQLDNFNSILQAQKDREMVNEYIKQQKLKEQYETEKQLALINQLGNAVNNIPTLPYDVNNYLYTEQLMTPSY